MLFNIFLTLHITSAAMLFGASLGVIRGCKRGLEISSAAFKMATDEAKRRGRLNLIASLLTLITGFSLIFLRPGGGFAGLTKNYHIALTLMLVVMVYNFFFVRPATKKLAEIGDQQNADKEDAMKAIKKLAAASGISHPLWLAILVLMIWRF